MKFFKSKIKIKNGSNRNGLFDYFVKKKKVLFDSANFDFESWIFSL